MTISPPIGVLLAVAATFVLTALIAEPEGTGPAPNPAVPSAAEQSR